MIQSRPTDAPAGTTPSRVLVVDDEPSITDLLSTALRYMGYEVTHRADRHGRARSRPGQRHPTSSCST